MREINAALCMNGSNAKAAMRQRPSAPTASVGPFQLAAMSEMRAPQSFEPNAAFVKSGSEQAFGALLLKNGILPRLGPSALLYF